ncbi:MafI family immunity protein [Gottfriedia sp. NPDC056225]|uniref:MafI family immunity protein n=1 Tax=Gottfriedia sp. NPDC056225 TaxID=3345751 RepID=UPI0035DF64FA
MNVEVKIKSIVEHIAVLPNRDRFIVLEYLEYNEWGVALEHLCTILNEEDIQISQDVFQLIKDVSLQMGLWEEIRNQIIGLVK